MSFNVTVATWWSRFKIKQVAQLWQRDRATHAPVNLITGGVGLYCDVLVVRRPTPSIARWKARGRLPVCDN